MSHDLTLKGTEERAEGGGKRREGRKGGRGMGEGEEGTEE